MATKEGRHQHIVRNDDGTVFLVNVTVSGNPLDRSDLPNAPESIKHQPSQSYLLSIGIDNGQQGRASKDAKYLSDTLVERGIIPESNALVVGSSRNPDDCSIQSIRQNFKTQCGKTGHDGILVFIYHGPGIKVAPKGWSLKPIDFNETDDTTHISGETLMVWLSEVETKPKHVILILDCSVAGGVVSDILLSSAIPSTQSIIILSNCTSPRESFVVDTLDHSIFTYFVARAFCQTHFVPDLIPIDAIFKKIKTCTAALSSLIVTYDPEGKILQSMELIPQSAFVSKQRLHPESFLSILEGDQQEDIDADIGRFEFLTKHYKSGKKGRVIVHPKAIAWLECVQENPKGPLAQLHECDSLHSEVLLTAFCLMLFSLMSIQVAHSKDSISNPNLFIVLFLMVASTIASINTEVNITDEHFKKARYFIFQVMNENGVKVEKMEDLFRNVMYDTQQVTKRD